jgi:hypothetical protein
MITPKENIKSILADWLDALRRHDFATVEGRMDPEVFWQGVREDFVCANRHEAIEMLREQQSGSRAGYGTRCGADPAGHVRVSLGRGVERSVAR